MKNQIIERVCHYMFWLTITLGFIYGVLGADTFMENGNYLRLVLFIVALPTIGYLGIRHGNLGKYFKDEEDDCIKQISHI